MNWKSWQLLYIYSQHKEFVFSTTINKDSRQENQKPREIIDASGLLITFFLLIKDTPSLEICYMSQFMRHRDLRWSADEYWCVCYMVNIQNFLPCNAFKTSFSTLIGSFIMTFLLRQLNLKAFFTYHPIRGCIQEAVDWFSLGIKRSLVVDFHSIIFVNYKTGVWWICWNW